MLYESLRGHRMSSALQGDHILALCLKNIPKVFSPLLTFYQNSDKIRDTKSKTFKKGRPLRRGRLPTPYTWDTLFSSFKNKHVFSAIMLTISQVIRTHHKLNYSSLLSAFDEVTRETTVSVRNSREEVI